MSQDDDKPDPAALVEAVMNSAPLVEAVLSAIDASPWAWLAEPEPEPSATTFQGLEAHFEREWLERNAPAPCPPPPEAELLGRIAALEARLDAPPVVPADEPKPRPQSRPQARRESLARILDALRELDPGLDLRAMPGTRDDLYTLCKALDDPSKNFHRISLRTFKNDIKGWLAFEHGREPGETSYYRDRLKNLRGKLA